MELEAENWWLDGTSHDFDDKKNRQKILIFFLSKIFFENVFRTFFVEIFPKHFRNFEIFIFSIDFLKKKFRTFFDLE